jgi:hypothetical protein
MQYLCLTLSIVVGMAFAARFFATKTRLVEKTIEETIARKLASSPLQVELVRLREENGVMRNLLIDMVENEASLAHATQMSEAEKTRAMAARTHRRRELFGEAIAALQKPGGGQDATFKFPTERA